MTTRSYFYHSADGLRLHVRIHGKGNGRAPVICLPGLTRNVRDFDALAEFLAQEAPSPRQVLCFDYRGRGLSERDPDWRNYNLGVETADVLAGLASLGIGRAAFIGTSRGGLILHLLAQAHPDRVAAAVLNDVGPELGVEGLTGIRDYLTARQEPETWPQAVAAQKAVHGHAFPALTDADWGRMARAIYRDRDGAPVLDFDPALVRTLADLDLSRPLPSLWPQFEQLAAAPLLAIRGEHSRLLLPETLTEMQRRCPAMQVFVVKGQGHAPLLDTGGLSGGIAAFLDDALPEF